MARKRTGSLYLTKSGWRGRVTVQVNGRTTQKSLDLGTMDKNVATALLAKVATGLPGYEKDTACARFARAALRGEECVSADGLSPAEAKEFALIAVRRGWSLVAVEGQSE